VQIGSRVLPTQENGMKNSETINRKEIKGKQSKGRME